MSCLLWDVMIIFLISIIAVWKTIQKNRSAFCFYGIIIFISRKAFINDNFVLILFWKHLYIAYLQLTTPSGRVLRIFIVQKKWNNVTNSLHNWTFFFLLISHCIISNYGNEQDMLHLLKVHVIILILFSFIHKMR